MKQSANNHLSEDFDSLRARLLNDALLWISLAGVVGAGLSLSRGYLFGWKPILLLHPFLVLVLWFAWWMRDRLSYDIRVFALLTVAWLSTFFGLTQLGPIALGGLHTVLFSFIAILFLRQRLAFSLITFNTLCLVVVGVAATQHSFNFDFDYGEYAYHPITWLRTVWGLTAYSLILAMIGRRMTEGLREREALANRLLEDQRKIASNLPGIIYQFLLRRDGSSCFPYVSESPLRLFGVDPTTFGDSGKSAFDLVHPDDMARLHQTIADSARNLTTIHESFRIVHPKNGVIWMERTSTPERLPNGDTLWHGFMRDISAIKTAEDRLAATLANTPNVAVQWYDLQGRVIYWNHASELIFGWTAAEAVGKTLDKLIRNEAENAEFLAALTRIVSTGIPVGPTEYTVRHRNGQEIIISSSRFTIPGDTSPVLVCMNVDITERKRAEAALAASESMFRMLLESSPMPILVKGSDQKTIVLNQCFTEVFGYTIDDLPDVDHWWMLAYPDTDERESLRREWYRRQAQSMISNTLFSMEATMNCKDGSIRSIEAFASATTNFTVIVFSDQTRKKLAEAELVRAKEAAEKANLAKTDFLANISHELRTPLNAIIGFAQMLDMGVPVPLESSQCDAVGHILGSGRHLLGLINEMLDLARIESGKTDVTIGAVALDPIVAEVTSITAPVAAKRQISLRHASNSGLVVLADAARLRQILLNLISNAVKYNREGGVVLVSSQIRGGQVRITIIDTGPGISKENHGKLFQPFQRLGAERTAIEGTGIGLVVSKQLAEAMGGSIGFESDLGVGSRFWIELPIAAADGNSAVIEPPVDAQSPRTDTLGGRVLYIEDNPANLAVMEYVFKQLPGVELLSAESAEIGLALVYERTFDLILMDINLPGMSGVEALKRLRSAPETSAIPVIAVSAAALPGEIQAGIDAGFVAYMTKPFDIIQLLEQLRINLQPNSGNI